MLVLMALACKKEPPPLGMILEDDGVVYAGAAMVDLTPEIRETFTDRNGNHDFDGCLDRPDGTDCDAGDEPFDDADGDGWFDAVFIGGFGPMRPATGVHDPVWARAVVLSQDEQYVAIVGLDFVGLGSPRIHAARDRLVADGFDGPRLVVASSHNHQGPDTMGLWGYPYDFQNPVSGIDPAYQERVTDAIETAVREAAAAMEPVDLHVGAVAMRDRGKAFNGALFGGVNPTEHMHGMIQDGRDPIVVSDQLLVLQGVGEGGTVFTLTNWSGHPETRGSSNNEISSDWVGVTRDVLEAQYGGMAMHVPECLGGMQSALGGDVPLVTDTGEHVLTDATDADGDPIPAWAPHDSWEFVTSHGWHIGEAAIDALADGEQIDAGPIRMETETIHVAIENLAYNILGPTGIFDLGLEDAVTDAALCPEMGLTAEGGCLPTQTSRLQVGPIEWVLVPGELLPELAWGFPTDDPRWERESSDLAARGTAESAYFRQHPRGCDDVDYAECRDAETVGDCDCTHMHVVPYALSFDPAQGPLLAAIDSPYKGVIGMADNYLSYIVPEPDFNTRVSLLSENDGDHYEDTVSPAHNFGTRVQEGQARIAERW